VPPEAKTLVKVKLALYQLQRLFAQLGQKSKRPVVAPTAYKALAMPAYFKANAGEQHDCSEFARVLLD